MSKETQTHAAHHGIAAESLHRFFKNDQFAERAGQDKTLAAAVERAVERLNNE